MIRYVKTFPFFVYMLVALKFQFWGIATGELIYILFSGFGFVTDYDVYNSIFFYVQLIIIAFMAFSLFMPENLAKICRMFCGRWDLVLYFLLGIVISISFQGFHITSVLFHLTGFQFILAELGAFIPFAVREYCKITKESSNGQKSPTSSFFNDAAIHDGDDGADLLHYSSLAEDFASKIYDNKSANSMIWGVEGPWGIGKSSFLNLCEVSLRKNHPREVTVVRFNALKYSGQYKDISIPLSDALRETVYKTLRCPELDILLAQYQRMIKGISFNVLGISMNFIPSPWNGSQILTYISEILRKSNKKFIFAIDDLDRLNEEEVYSLLYSIKEIFNIPFISYVLCYDLDNLSRGMGTDKTAQKNVEFLEKFVQSKISLFTNKDAILRTLDEDIKVLMKDTVLDVEANKKALEGVRSILVSDDAAEYIPFFGNLRKVKRYVNILTTLDIQRVDFPDFDFDERQLTELILLYMYCPVVFRRIYMRGSWRPQKHLFTSYEDFDEHKNRKTIPEKAVGPEIDGLENLYTDVACILNNLFGTKESKKLIEEGTNRKHLNVKDKESLSQYMELIVNHKKRSMYEQTNFYINRVNSYINGQRTFSAIFLNLLLESYHVNLWNVLAKSKFNEFARYKIKEVIQYGISHIVDYSYLGSSNYNGLRNVLPRDIRLLFGHLDDSENKEIENIKFIQDMIFGNDGIINQLSDPSRGILGIFDLLNFRDACRYETISGHAVSEGILFYTAIGSFDNHSFQLQGTFEDIVREEMRSLSQRCFEIFKKNYIDKHIDFIAEVEELNFEKLKGIYALDLVDSESGTDVKDKSGIEASVQKVKSSIVNLIVRQFADAFNKPANECGFYDEKGARDNREIRKSFREYLHRDVFNTPNSMASWQAYLLLIAYEPGVFTLKGTTDRDTITESDIEISIDVVEKYMGWVMDKSQLVSWWKNNHTKVGVVEVGHNDIFYVFGACLNGSQVLKMYYRAFDKAYLDDTSK